jgi:hypothetical protein
VIGFVKEANVNVRQESLLTTEALGLTEFSSVSDRVFGWSDATARHYKAQAEEVIDRIGTLLHLVDSKLTLSELTKNVQTSI